MAKDALVRKVAKVVASDVPFSVMAGVLMLPVKVGLAIGALSDKVVVRGTPAIVIAGVLMLPVKVGLARGA